MSTPIIDTIQTALFGSTGSYTLMAIGIMAFFFIGFIVLGMPFKYSLMFTSPMILGFVEIGWFPQVVGFIFWLLVAGLGIFLLISQISDR